jgi:hypothetical protein
MNKMILSVPRGRAATGIDLRPVGNHIKGSFMSRVSLEERLAAAAKIKASPQNFKVCESCGSIVARKSVSCPNCSAYRFDIDPAMVVHQADLLASRAPLSIESKDYI